MANEVFKEQVVDDSDVDLEIGSGRLVTLLSWLDRLPATTLADQPQLLIARGDALRMLARFDDALAAYAEAERCSTARARPGP